MFTSTAPPANPIHGSIWEHTYTKKQLKYNIHTGTWDPLKHPRGFHGKFTTSGATQPVIGVKGHKPDYVPPVWAKIKGVNASADGMKLYKRKMAGEFANDHELYLAAAKFAAAHKKIHPNDAASANSIYNAALRHEIDEHGSHTMLPQLGVTPKATPAAPTAPTAPPKNVHGTTPAGMKIVSKHLAPGQLAWTGKTLGGVSGARVYKDHNGVEWIVKVPGGWKGTSKAYSNSKFLSDLDVATSRIQNKAGLPVPAVHKVVIEGREASVQKMYSRATDAFPNHNPQLDKLDDADKLAVQKHMVLDWLLSNHDAHSGNFLKTDKGIVGIDKGQSFKYFGKDKLTPNFGSDLNPPLAPNKPVYSTLMKQHMAGQGELQPFDSGELAATISRIQNIPDSEYADLLRPYAIEAAKLGMLAKSSPHPNDVKAFLDAAVARKNNLANDFQQLQSTLDAGKAPTPAPASAHTIKDVADDYKVGEHVAVSWPNGTIKTGNIIESGATAFKFKTATNSPFKITQKADGTWTSASGAEVKVDKIAANQAPTAATGLEGDDPSQVIKLFAQGAITGDELKAFVKESNKVSQKDIDKWWHKGLVSQDFAIELDKAFAANQAPTAAKVSPEEFAANVATQKLAPGYEVVPHPTSSGLFAIKKPTGGFSQNTSGDTKSWPTKEDALNSSTMAKYKAQARQSAQYEKASAKNFANAAPNYTKEQIGSYPQEDLDKYNELKAKISAGTDTGDEYAQFKSLKSKFDNAKKAAGAAQIEHGFENESGGFTPPAKPPAPAINSKKLGGMSWKAKGGAPPGWDKIKGPDVKELGAELWQRKKAGEFANVYEMYKAAAKLSATQKKKADQGQTLEAGVHYASANQLRNAALRTEFDETGNVIWETAEEKTSHEVGQTVAEINHTISLHDHKPVVPASPGQNTATHAQEFGNKAFDPSAPVGSYTNPHAFKTGDKKNLEKYGYKYTDHTSWPQDQKSAWYNFSGSGSGTLNTFFRTGNVGSFGDPVAIKKRAKALVDAFESPNVKPLDDWTMVVRGTSGGWELGIPSDAVTFDEMKAMEGKVVRNKCPVSSALRDQPPWGNLRITYKLPPGFRGLGIYGKSAHSGENEMILPPGMAYRILEVKKGTSYSSEVLVEVVDVKLPKIDDV